MLFHGWRTYFEGRRQRPWPCIADTGEIPIALRRPLAESLARLQLGETGEGRIVADVRARAAAWGVPSDYVTALGLFVAEEGRHAAILGTAVRALGGRPVRRTATAIAFAKLRRLAGPRLELAVLLGAEVAALALYGTLVEHLPAGELRDALDDIARDEGMHLLFHVDFFRSIAVGSVRRAVLARGWAVLGMAAGLIVALDHRLTLRDLGSSPRAVASRAAEIARWTTEALTTPADAPPGPAPGPTASHPVAPNAGDRASGSRATATARP